MALSTISRARMHCSAARNAGVCVVAETVTRNNRRKMRHTRIRKKLSGTEDRPRLSVFRSNKEIYVQVIDDSKGCTLAAANTMQKPIRASLEEAGKKHGSDKEAAAMVGKAIAEACLDKGITKITFDRSGYQYHGRVAALADAAREAGLDF